MIARLLVVSLISRQVAADWKIRGDSKVVGGHNVTNITEYPFMVIIFEGHEQACGGSILTPLFVLSACHCLSLRQNTSSYATVDDKSKFTFVAGTVLRDPTERNVPPGIVQNIQARQPKAFYLHPKCYKFAGIGAFNDLGLAEMKQPFVYNEFVQPIGILTQYYATFVEAKDALFNDETIVCLVAGWGAIENPYQEEWWTNGLTYVYGPFLKVVRMFPISEQHCEFIYHNIRASPGYAFPLRDQTCAISKHFNESDCVGDSGGPFFCNNYLLGVASFGSECGTAAPSVHQLLTPMYKWIRKALPELARTLGIEKDCPPSPRPNERDDDNAVVPSGSSLTYNGPTYSWISLSSLASLSVFTLRNS